MDHRPNLINISKKSFISVVIILFLLMIAAGVMTRIIPAGAFSRDENLSIIPGTFAYLDNPELLPIWKWFLAPFLVFGTSDGLSIAMIAIFLLILGGAFTVMDKTDGIKLLLKKLISRFKDNKYLLLRLFILVFMLFGAFFVIFEDCVALLPIMIILSISLGWDSMLGLGMCLLEAGFGFASGITNPFSVGVASTIAGVNILSGLLYRLLLFALMYLLLQFFLVRYARKIETDPQQSMTYEDDQKKATDESLFDNASYPNENLIFKAYLTMFLAVLGIVILTSVLELFDVLSIPSIPVMALAFLVGG